MVEQLTYKNMERITCSAIWIQWIEQLHRPKNITSWFVVAGHRHCNCIETIAEMDKMVNWKRINVTNQWFLTSENRYVSREEWFKIAKKANQIIKQHWKNILFSEDIY